MSLHQIPPRRIFSNAFTLIEILIVVVVLGIVAGLAVPNFSGTFLDLQLSETSKNIAHLMHYAQDRSIVKEKEHGVCFDFSNGRYWLEEDVSAKGGADAPESQPLFQKVVNRYAKTFSIPGEVKAESEYSSVSFYPDGRIAPARIYLVSKRGRYWTVSTQEEAGSVGVFDFKVE